MFLITIEVQVHGFDPALVGLERLLLCLELGDERLEAAGALNRLGRCLFLWAQVHRPDSFIISVYFEQHWKRVEKNFVAITCLYLNSVNCLSKICD